MTKKQKLTRIKEVCHAATLALALEEKLTGQKQIKALEAQRSEKCRSLKTNRKSIRDSMETYMNGTRRCP